MDIKKIVRKFLLEQPDGDAPQETPKPAQQLSKAQRELFTRLITKWRETFPEMTVEDALLIFNKYREALPQIKDESVQAVKAFLYRGNGKYTINDLRDASKVDIKDLLSFLLEFKKFRFKPGGEGEGEKIDPEVARMNTTFRENGAKITEGKIEASKSMWESQENLVIDEGDFRVYSVNTMEDAKRYGYYYQDKLKELILNNIKTKKHPTDALPWCVFSRGDDQTVSINGKLIIKSVSNQYRYYRQTPKYSFYVVIDESRDLFGPGGEYYIGTIMRTSQGSFLLSSMYNGEYNISEGDLIRKYPKLNGHLDKLIYKEFDSKVEVDSEVPLTILDIVNEQEGSPNAFWMQGPDEKEEYINQGGYLRNPKSWSTLSNDLRETYINSIVAGNTAQKVATEEFFRSIVESGIGWKNKLDRRLKILGKTGIGYLADNFMKENYGPDFYGMKNQNIRIYKRHRTTYFGIYDVEDGDWVTKDGITYDCTFTKNILRKPDNLLLDRQTKIHYLVTEFESSEGKFYILKNIKEVGKNFNVYMMSEKKYRELREKLESETEGDEYQGLDDTNDVDIAEEQY